jgi:dTDP-4-dehydrorhamnose 3,5-epimerase
MKLIETKIKGAWIVENTTFEDYRGIFSRVFCNEMMSAALRGKVVAQSNISITHSIGAIRGMHFQYPPHAEIKIVRCLKGKVFDVVVDLRKHSPTFLSWQAVELSGYNKLSFVIPEGCAHGFQVLEESSELLYFHTHPYTPEAEGTVRYDDPRVNIRWPLKPTDISDKDASHLNLNYDFKGVEI